MAITNGYATLAEYKAWIAVRGLAGAVGTDASDDTVIELLIEAASRYIDRETARRFFLTATDETRYYQADESNKLWVDEIGSLTSISVDYLGTRATYTALNSTDYDTIPTNAVVEGLPIVGFEIDDTNSTAYFTTYKKGVKVVGKFGWPAVPADIKEACLSIAQSLSGSRSGQTSSGKVTVTAAGVVIRPEDVPAFAQKVINHYKALV